MSLTAEIRAVFASMATSLPDAVHTLRTFDGEAHRCIKTRSTDFADPVTDDEPLEATRVMCDASDFPLLNLGAAVFFDDTVRVVTSLTADPIGATLTAGLSPAFGQTVVTFDGARRRESGNVEKIREAVDALVVENGTAASFSAAIAPTYASSFSVIVRMEDWLDVTAPQVGDTLTFFAGGVTVTAKVGAVTSKHGVHSIKARAR